MKLITTSWDDGHPKDFDIADLLEKHHIKGTFYIPQGNAEHTVMHESDIVALSRRQEIGGHTLNHTRLKKKNMKLVQSEVLGSYNWLKQLTGTAPVSFCFPGGEYNRQVIDCALASGYKILRTTELLSVSIANRNRCIPTTIQMFGHSRFTLLKHLLLRLKLVNLSLWMRSGSLSDLERLIDFYLAQIDQKGGCLHLWGHSWEIEENGLWKKLDAVLRRLSDHDDFSYISNGEIVNYL